MNIDDFLDKESKDKTKEESSSEIKVDEDAEEKTADEADELARRIQDIRKLMEEKKFDIAEKRYMEVKESYALLAKRQLEQQNRLYNELVSINKGMVDGLNILRQETKKKIGIVRELMARIHQHLEHNELEVANQIYTELTALFKSLPDVIPEEKVRLEQEMLSLHVALSNKNNTTATADFQTKFREIQNMLNYAFNSLRQGDVNSATTMYQKINTLYNQLPEGFLYEKAVAYQQILKLFKIVDHGHTKPVEQPGQEALKEQDSKAAKDANVESELKS